MYVKAGISEHAYLFFLFHAPKLQKSSEKGCMSGHKCYSIPYLFILRYNVVGFMLSILAALVLLPLHDSKVRIISCFSASSSLIGRKSGTIFVTLSLVDLRIFKSEAAITGTLEISNDSVKFEVVQPWLSR